MNTSLATTQRVNLLREVADGPNAVLFAGERARGAWATPVAVKVLRPGSARTSGQLARARDAGRALTCLAHRHIVAATDLAVVDDRPALLGPWVDGLDLLDWMEILRETRSPLPARVACEIVRATASALDAALNRTPWGAGAPLGLVHQDVKPSNLMVDRDGELRVLDFGTGISALWRAGAQGNNTKYWCPQRHAGAPAAGASDVYALGVLAIELFRGGWLRRLRRSNPAHDRHLAEVVAALPELALRGAEDDRALRSMLLRMVAHDPEARPQAVVVAKTMRRLADRASGPTLESFAHDHVLPYVEAPIAVQGLPDGILVEPNAIDALPTLDSIPPVMLPDHDDEESTGTERVAELTAKALRDYRRRRAAENAASADVESTTWVPDVEVMLAELHSMPPAARYSDAEAPPTEPDLPQPPAKRQGGTGLTLLAGLAVAGALVLGTAAISAVVAVLVMWFQ